VKKIPLWLSYTLLRVAFFAVPFAVLMLFNITWWISAILAAIIGLSSSYIFLARLRNRMSTAIYEARVKQKSGAPGADETAEDSAV
jgi:membrane protein implicated in regulation of membrane protease activity